MLVSLVSLVYAATVLWNGLSKTSSARSSS